MPEVTRRRSGEFLRKLFEILIPHPEGLPAREALAALREKLALTDYELGFYASGRQRFDCIVRFGTVDCTKAGWFLKQKGRWSVTEEGKQAYATITDPEAFHRRAAQLYNEWKSSQPGADEVIDETDESSGGRQQASQSNRPKNRLGGKLSTICVK